MMINKQGLQVLVENHMFRLFDIYGLDLPYEEVIRLLEEDDIYIESDRLLKDAYDFVSDQAGINYMVSPITQDVLKIINKNISYNIPGGNNSPIDVRDEVHQYLLLQGQVDHLTAERIAANVRELLLDLVQDIDTYQ